MAKTKEELNALKAELEALNNKIKELDAEELENIAGGMISFEPLRELLRKYNINKFQLKDGILNPAHINRLPTKHLDIISIICEKFNIDREELLEFLENYEEQ